MSVIYFDAPIITVVIVLSGNPVGEWSPFRWHLPGGQSAFIVTDLSELLGLRLRLGYSGLDGFAVRHSLCLEFYAEACVVNYAAIVVS